MINTDCIEFYENYFKKKIKSLMIWYFVLTIKKNKYNK